MTSIVCVNINDHNFMYNILEVVSIGLVRNIEYECVSLKNDVNIIL